MAEFNLTPVFRMEMFIDAIINGTTPPEPHFREEFYFAKVAGMDVELPTPITRREFYLAKYAGMDVDPPAPVTRDEMYLALACGLGVEPPEPVFRDEYWLYELSGGGKWSWKTVSGSMIHITDAVPSPMQKCEVTLEPVQDLHGQDAPYPAGGGVNKFNPTDGDVGKWCGSSGNIYDNASSYISPSYTPSGTKLTASWENNGMYSFIYICYDANGDFLSREIYYNSQSGTTYTLPEGTVSVRFGVSGNNITITTDIVASWKIQVEEGQAATPYSPNSNICPITGWTGCEVTRTGKNLIDPAHKDYAYGSILRWYSNDGFLLHKNVKYSLSNNLDLGTMYICDKATGTSLKSGNKKVTYTPTEDILAYFQIYYTTIGDYLAQLEIAPDATAFEEYQGTTLSVTFPDSAGTVYGGTVDLVSGVLTVTHKYASLTGCVWSGNQNDTIAIEAYTHSISGKKKGATNIISDKLKTKGSFANVAEYSVRGFASDGDIAVKIPKSVASGYAELKTWVDNNDVHVCFELDEPFTIQLTPQEISTLAGENNVWSNGDSVEITYKAQA